MIDLGMAESVERRQLSRRLEQISLGLGPVRGAYIRYFL